MKYNNTSLHLLIVLIFSLTLVSISKSAFCLNAYPGIEIGSEGEIPTLIKYGDKIPGFSSNTLYAAIPVNNDGSSSGLLILSFNVTVYGLADIVTDQGSARSYAYIMGWWPINPLVWAIAADGPGDDYIISI